MAYSYPPRQEVADTPGCATVVDRRAARHFSLGRRDRSAMRAVSIFPPDKDVSMWDPNTWDVLSCPFDQGPLDGNDSWLVCRDCGRGYPVLDGIPTFLCRAAAPGMCPQADSVRLAQPGPAAARVRAESPELERLLARFGHYTADSRLLQLGAARGGGLVSFRWGQHYAADPRAGRWQQRGLLPDDGLHWLAACGHELPLGGSQFDGVLLLNPPRIIAALSAQLSEAARCLSDEGALCVTLDRTERRGSVLVETAGRTGLQFLWSCAIDSEHQAFVLRRAARYTSVPETATIAETLRLVA